MSRISAVNSALRELPQTSLEVGGSAVKLFTTFDEAVTEGDLELADASLRLIEVSIMLRNDESPATDLVMNELVRCHAHLWHLRHASAQAVAA